MEISLLTMLDTHSKDKFLNQLPDDMRRAINFLESKESWIQEGDDEVTQLLDELGVRLQSYQKLDKLRQLPTEMLVKLLICVSISRYFSFFSEITNFKDYSNLTIRVHNDLTHEDADTENYQRTLISRLQSVVKLNMLSRVYSQERINLMKNVLKRENT